MNNRDKAWAWTAGLIAIHQAEEVLVSVDDWFRRVGTTGSPWLDRHIDGNWMADHKASKRLAAQAAQTTALMMAWRLSRDSDLATRTLTRILVAGWSAAFGMHIAASIHTRTVMPGTSTSVIPGWLGSAIVMRQVRTLTNSADRPAPPPD